jgi:restriction system-associated AAA family ATPase
MRLLNVVLNSKFRGLPAGSKFSFDGVELSDGKLEPICFVGLNGSGKSNLLEAITEIFHYLETYVLLKGRPRSKFSTPFAFEIRYKLDVTFQLASRENLGNLSKLNWEGSRETEITITKNSNELPQITLKTIQGQIQIEKSTDPDVFILPNHIIAYSSGMNELLSTPFLKSEYRYFDELEKLRKENPGADLGLPRLFRLDFEANQLATICNYLFSEQNEVSLISKAVNIEGLDSFTLSIKFRNYRNSKVDLPQILLNAIENLRSCCTASEEISLNNSYRELKLCFLNDSELRRAIQLKFGSAIMLFRDLFYLRLMNIHTHQASIRNRIMNAGSLDDNLSALVPITPKEKLIFTVESIKLRKSNEREPVKYKNLSDGEHQLIHVLGSIMLLNTSGSLLLYDEPETHFNPEWRSQLISLINKATRDKADKNGIRKQEIIITSHSPFIVSDCRKERVFVFKNGIATNPAINTFGTSVSILTEEVFNKKETISGLPIQEIEGIRSLSLKTLEEIAAAKNAARVLGESIEKVMLFRELLILEEKIRRNDKKL